MSKGFTLIELVIVIVILGILASTAVPKFVSLSKDARSEVLTQVSVSVKIANDFMYIKSKLPSYSSQPDPTRPRIIDVDIDGDGSFDVFGSDAVDVRLIWNYLDNTDIQKRIEISDEFVFQEEGSPVVYVGYDHDNDGNVLEDNCYFKYTQAASATEPPVYEVVDSGC